MLSSRKLKRWVLTAALFAVLLTGWSRVALHAQPAQEQNMYRLAQAYERSAQYKLALQYFRELVQLRPGQPVYFDGLVRVLTQLKQYDTLIVILNDRIKRYPNQLQLRATLGSVYARAGHDEEAVKAWDAMVAAFPDNPAVYRIVARNALDNRMFDEAERYLKKGREVSGNVVLFGQELARAYAMQLRFRDAMNEFVRVILAAPSMLGEVERQVAQFTSLPEALDVAREVAFEAADDHSDNLYLQYFAAWISMEGKDYRGAFTVYRNIDRLRGSQGLEVMNFAQRAFREQEYDVAREAYRYVLDEYPETMQAQEARFYYARSLEELAVGTREDGGAVPTGNDEIQHAALEKVVRLYQDIVNADPDGRLGAEARYRLGIIHWRQFNDADRAVELLKKCAKNRGRFSHSADAELLIGDILLAEGDLERARAQYQQVLALQHLSKDYRELATFHVAEIEYFSGNFDTASKILENLSGNSSSDIANDAMKLGIFIAENRRPTDAPLQRYAKAEFLQRQHKDSEAAATLENLITTFPSSPIVDRATLTLAGIYRRLKRYGEARATLERFVKEEEESILRDEALFSLARIYEDTSEHEKAIATYGLLLKDFPHSLYVDEARKRIRALRENRL